MTNLAKLDLPCKICLTPVALNRYNELRAEGRGRDFIWASLSEFGVGKHQISRHRQHFDGAAFSNNAALKAALDPVEAVEDYIDEAEEVTIDWFVRHGIELPPGFVAGTIEVRVGDTKHWLRVKPEGDPADRVEIRQAEPIRLPSRSRVSIQDPGDWQLWAVIPDCQIGYWVDFEGNFHSTHDERSFDLGHQIIDYMRKKHPLHGIIDVGDFMDLAAAGRWDPTAIDTSVHAVNASIERASQELAWRSERANQVVAMSGNHDDRLREFAAKAGAWLVGLQRAGEPEEQWPVFSVPYLVRACDYGVEWIDNFPGSYYKLNNNLVVMHSPRLGSKPFDTAKQIASTIHASVIHGHTHRSERASFNLETTEKGVRTFTVWSSGCWARIDGSLPSGKSTYDSYGNRMLAGQQGPNVGVLSENFHQGMDFVWVETAGEQRWSSEHVDFWGPWAQFRGQEFYSAVDVEGKAI